MQNIEYLTSKDGKAIAVVIPINKAINEVIDTPLMDRSTALAYLEE